MQCEARAHEARYDDEDDSPQVVLLVALPSCAQLARAQLRQPPAQQLRRPTELLVRGVSEAEHGKCQVLEEVFGQVGAEEHLPERSHCAGLAAGAGGRYHEEHDLLVDQLGLQCRSEHERGPLMRRTRKTNLQESMPPCCALAHGYAGIDRGARACLQHLVLSPSLWHREW